MAGRRWPVLFPLLWDSILDTVGQVRAKVMHGDHDEGEMRQLATPQFVDASIDTDLFSVNGAGTQGAGPRSIV